MVWILANWRLLSKLAGILAIVAIVILINHWRLKAQEAEKLKHDLFEINNSIALRNAEEKRSFGIGINLEDGLNDYKNRVAEIDREILSNPNGDANNRIDAHGVQRIKNRIAAGESSRQQFNPMF